MSLGHDAYQLKSLSFELSLSILGFNQFLNKYSDIDSDIYKNYNFYYFNLVKVKLLELAIHQRSLDDEYKELLKNNRSAFDSEMFEREYNNQLFCFDCNLKKPIDSLREASNKIIHAKDFKTLQKQEIEFIYLENYLDPEMKENILILKGNNHHKPWVVALDGVKYCEQTFLFGEILSEWYGI